MRTVLYAFVGVLAASPSLAAVETARVEIDGGVPRLVVDGQPIRARMFWGGPEKAIPARSSNRSGWPPKPASTW